MKSLGKSNDRGKRVRAEIRAAMLHAAYETAHDDDAVLADRITRNCTMAMLGEEDLLPESEEVYDLAMAIASCPGHYSRGAGRFGEGFALAEGRDALAEGGGR